MPGIRPVFTNTWKLGINLRLPFLPGLHSPTNVKAEAAVNDAKFLIISWDYQPAVNYNTIHVRNYIKTPGISGSSTTVAGPTDVPCTNLTCSFCVADVKQNASCYAFNPEYTFSVATELNFDFLLSYRVGACSRNESSSCINSPWKHFTIPPGGKLK